ncbi:unnamed protein product [Schistosoma curassoni]|uniref:Uncharacterized protein n=1 Tax=Schistosoma curassoni TaxID=6186 RepID=A0A183KG19_9TREM|nr:unnamed protein product [Schistosoma curassoni]
MVHLNRSLSITAQCSAVFPFLSVSTQNSSNNFPLEFNSSFGCFLFLIH